MNKIIFITFFILVISGCSLKSPFNFSMDYRQDPIAVDCEKPTDVDLTFSKTGMPTIKVSANNVEFREIKDIAGKLHGICIFQDLNLLQFCQYKGKEAVAPYWVAGYGKIDSVKCSEILK